MVEKAKFYISRPDLILKIAEAGHNRVIKEHLWEHRFKSFFTYIETNCL
jgi:spore maturation protein CgeB